MQLCITFFMSSKFDAVIMSLRVVFDVAHVGNEARQLVEADLVDVVTAHAVEEIRILIDNVLVIKEELVWLEQLLLLHIQHVLLNIIAHDVEILHIVVRYSLTAKHDQVVCIDHVQSNKPNAPICYCVQHYPGIAFDVKLLNACPVATRFIPNRVYEAAAKCTTVGSSNGLL